MFPDHLLDPGSLPPSSDEHFGSRALPFLSSPPPSLLLAASHQILFNTAENLPFKARTHPSRR